MCTLTWRTDDDLEVFFNRDELKTRSRALPPREHQTPDGTRYLSPIDPDAGGTWMLANEHGLVICLLNRWHITSTLNPNASPPKSRGQLVSSLAATRKLTSLINDLPKLSESTKPFDLFAFHHNQMVAHSWDGQTLTASSPKMPSTSSSYQFEKVKAAREKSFALQPSLEQYQCSQNEEPSAFTVRMNRPDAQTWSRSHLTIGSKIITWHYWEEFSNLEKEPALHQTTLALS